MQALALKHCIVVTSFDEGQPGYLDFSYRIKALYQHYQLTIISQKPIVQAELQYSQAKYKVLDQAQGKIGWLSYLWKSAAYIRKQSPAVVVLLHSGLSPITLLAPKVPSVLYWNEHPTNLIHLPEKWSIFKYLLTASLHHLMFLGAKRANLVMPIGEEHRDELLTKGCKSSQVNMLYMGVADSFILPQPIKSLPAESVKLIYIGTVSPPRGRDVMLEAMAILTKRGLPVHLTIVGAWDDQLAYCQNRAEQLNIAANITVVGRVPGEKIPMLLSQADIGVCLWEDRPWWRFNPPTKLFEYLVAGLPVLASNIRTHTRYIHDWQNGLVFEYSADGLASVVATLMQNRQRLTVLKKNAATTGKSYLWSDIEPHFIRSVARLVSS